MMKVDDFNEHVRVNGLIEKTYESMKIENDEYLDIDFDDNTLFQKIKAPMLPEEICQPDGERFRLDKFSITSLF